MRFFLTGSSEAVLVAAGGSEGLAGVSASDGDGALFAAGGGDRGRFFSGEGLLFLEALSGEGLLFLETLWGEGLLFLEALSGEGLLFLETLSGEGLLFLEAFSGEGLLFLETRSGDATRAFFEAGVKSNSEPLLSLSSSTVLADLGLFLMLENSLVETFAGVEFFLSFSSLSSLAACCVLDFGPGLADLGPRNFDDLGPGFELFGPGLESPGLESPALFGVGGAEDGFLALGRIFLLGVPSEVVSLMGVFLTLAPPSEALTTRIFLL